MEEFRPLLVDSAVLTAVNTGMVDTGCFELGAAGCAMSARGRKAFLAAFEARLDQLMTHPTFDYRVSWRRTAAATGEVRGGRAGVAGPARGAQAR